MAARGNSGTRRWSRRRSAAIGVTALVAAFAVEGPALAATSGTGTTNVSISAGSLAVTNVAGATTMTGTIGGTVTGLLPAVTMQDTTASGAGWNATVATSQLVHTGAWTPVGTSTALTTTTSNAFTGSLDSISYTVTVTGTGIALGGGNFSYTSNDPGDASGTGTVSSGSGTVGTRGLTITFGAQVILAGSQYQIKVGTLQNNMVLNTGVCGAGVVTSSGNTAPTLLNNATTVTGGGPGSTTYGTAVKFASAVANTGMGTYVLTPGVSVTTGSASWAGTYTAGVQYSIVSGP